MNTLTLFECIVVVLMLINTAFIFGIFWCIATAYDETKRYWKQWLTL